MKFTYTEVQKKAIEIAKQQLNIADVLKKDSQIAEINASRKELNTVYKKRHPLVKEYIKLFTEQEKEPNTYIGRMVKDRNKAIVMKELLKRAAELCTDPKDKQDLLNKSAEYECSPQILNYEKYLDGLRYMAGMSDTLDPRTANFFTQELRVPITKDADYNKYRQVDYNELKKTRSKNLNKYQEKLAPKLAEFLYAQSSFDISTFAYQYLPDYPTSKRAKVSYMNDRITPSAFLLGRMLNEGYTLEQATDPQQFRDVKERLGKEYMEHREAGDRAWYLNQMIEGAKAMMKEFDAYCHRYKDALQTDKNLTLQSNQICMLGQFSFDLFQELRSFYKDATTKNPKLLDELGLDGKLNYPLDEFNEVADKAAAYGNLTLEFSVRHFNYEECNEGPQVLNNLLVNHMAKKQLLKEIQKENPDFSNVNITLDDYYQINVQLHPHLEEMGVLGMADKHVNSMSEKQLNQMIDILDGSFVEKNKFSYHKPRTPFKVVDQNSPLYSPDTNPTLILFKGNSQSIQTNIPVKTEMYLASLDKGASLRGSDSVNSKEFNSLLNNFDGVRKNLESKNFSNEDYLAEMNKIKAAAEAYILSKREQKGYKGTSITNTSYDDMMLGKKDSAGSIFTTRGKERYEFALKIVQNITALENAMKAPEMEEANKSMNPDDNHHEMLPDEIDANEASI